MQRKTIIDAARKLLQQQELGCFSVSQLTQQLGISKRAFYNEFQNQADLFAAVLIDDLLIRYNTGTYILGLEDLNPFEQLCLFSAIGLEKTLSNKHDQGALFLLPKHRIWRDLPEETEQELRATYARLYRFVDRVLLEAPKLQISEQKLERIRIKLNALERGLLVLQLNHVNPDSHLQLADLINILSEEICGLFLCRRTCIDDAKILRLTRDFLDRPPQWAAIYQRHDPR